MPELSEISDFVKVGRGRPGNYSEGPSRPVISEPSFESTPPLIPPNSPRTSQRKGAKALPVGQTTKLTLRIPWHSLADAESSVVPRFPRDCGV